MDQIIKPKYKTLAVIFISVLMILLLGFFQKGVKGFFYSISHPFQEILWNSGNSASISSEGFFRGGALKKENEELKLRNKELLSQNVLLKELKEENEFLRKALNVGLQKDYQLSLANFISKDISGDSILINKGSESGISVGMPVITEQKVLLGKVSEVGDKFSRVTLISNKESSFPVTIQTVKAVAVIKGRGNLQLFLEQIPQDKDIKEKDIVVTSSLGGDFPKGLLIGEIERVERSDVKTFQKAEVMPFFNLKELRSVFIITDF